MAENKNTELWQCELEKPIDRLTNMRKRNLFTDCKFKVEGKTFDVHKNVLAMSSPVFERMFFGSFPLDNNDPISIDDLDAATFEFILNYIYRDYTKIETLEEASSVLYAARKYMLNALENFCVSYLEKILVCKNVFEVYEIASKYDIQQLKDSCAKIFTEKTNEVFLDCDYKRIDIDTLLFILKQTEVNCSEMELFGVIEGYVKANNIPIGDDGIAAHGKLNTKNKKLKTSSNNGVGVDNRSEESRKIFEAVKSIRFLSMKTSEFAKGPALSNLLSKEEKLSIFANLATVDETLPLPVGFSTMRSQRNPKRPRNGKYRVVLVRMD